MWRATLLKLKILKRLVADFIVEKLFVHDRGIFKHIQIKRKIVFLLLFYINLILIIISKNAHQKYSQLLQI